MVREGAEISDLLRFVLRSKQGSFELSEGESLVGRSRSCQVVVKDPSVSRSHALLILREGDLAVKDLSSSNGTYVNGKRIQSETPLAPGDRLTLGETHLDLEGLEGEGQESDDYSFAGLIAEVEAQEEGEVRIVDPVMETLQPSAEPGSASSGLVGDEGEEASSLEEDPRNYETAGAGGPVVEAEILFEEDGAEASVPSAVPAVPEGELSPPEEEPSPPIAELSPPEDEPPAPAAEPPAPAAEPPPPSADPPRPAPIPPAAAPKAVAPKPTPESTLGSDTVQEAMRRLAALKASAEEPSPPPAEGETEPPPPPAATVKGDDGELLPSLDELDALMALPAPPGPAPSVPAPAGPAPARPAPRPPSTAAAGAPRSVAQLDRVPRSRPVQPAGEPAGLGVRIGAGLLDAVLVAGLSFMASLAGGGPWQPEGGAIFYTGLFGIALLIQVFGLNLWGTTPGKRMLGLYVFDEGGEPTLSVGRALARFGGYLLSGLSLGFGFLMILFTRSRRGLHDVLAGTYVGRKK